MKITELIDKCMLDRVVISNKSYKLSIGVVTLPNGVDVFVWVWESGEIARSEDSRSGYMDVILSPKLISDKGWYVNKSIKVNNVC